MEPNVESDDCEVLMACVSRQDLFVRSLCKSVARSHDLAQVDVTFGQLLAFQVKSIKCTGLRQLHLVVDQD